jgi:hypothetical protein
MEKKKVAFDILVEAIRKEFNVIIESNGVEDDPAEPNLLGTLKFGGIEIYLYGEDPEPTGGYIALWNLGKIAYPGDIPPEERVEIENRTIKIINQESFKEEAPKLPEVPLTGLTDYVLSVKYVESLKSYLVEIEALSFVIKQDEKGGFYIGEEPFHFDITFKPKPTDTLSEQLNEVTMTMYTLRKLLSAQSNHFKTVRQYEKPDEEKDKKE